MKFFSDRFQLQLQLQVRTDLIGGFLKMTKQLLLLLAITWQCLLICVAFNFYFIKSGLLSNHLLLSVSFFKCVASWHIFQIKLMLRFLLKWQSGKFVATIGPESLQIDWLIGKRSFFSLLYSLSVKFLLFLQPFTMYVQRYVKSNICYLFKKIWEKK